MGLLEQFASYVVESYGGGTSAVTIKFEAIGHPLEAQDVSDYAFSRLANVYPRHDSTVFVEAAQNLDALYATLVDNAAMASGPASAAFNRTKSRARANLDKSAMAPPGPVPIFYHHSSAIPDDWFGNDDRWLTYPAPSLKSEPGAANAQAGAVGNDLEIRTAPDARDGAGTPMALTVVGASPAQPPRTARKAAGYVSDMVARVAATRALVTDAVPSTTADPTLSLQYTLVKIERQWLDQGLFSLFRDWHIAGMAAGQISAPPVGLTLIPVAAIVVRDFAVTAPWSAADAARLASAVSLGPFALAGGTWSPDDGALRNPRTQIIGWLCTPVPSLPPQSDPSLALKRVGFIKVEHHGLYVAKFAVAWQEKDATGVYVDKSWASGDTTMGYEYQLAMAADAINLRIEAWAATGLAWGPWGQIMSISAPAPTNKLYKVTGTTLHSDYETLDP